MDEELLIQAAKENDLDAFNQLVLKYQQNVYNVALRILDDLDEADDVTQQAFISAYQHIRTFKSGSFQAWILRIVTNKCYDILRHSQRHPTQSIEGENEDLDTNGENSCLMQDNAPSPEEQAVLKEQESVVQHCIDRLPKEFKAVVILVDLQGMDYQEAAQVCRIPLGTIKSRLARARVYLKDCLSKFEELLPQPYRSKNEGSHD